MWNEPTARKRKVSTKDGTGSNVVREMLAADLLLSGRITTPRLIGEELCFARSCWWELWVSLKSLSIPHSPSDPFASLHCSLPFVLLRSSFPRCTFSHLSLFLPSSSCPGTLPLLWVKPSLVSVSIFSRWNRAKTRDVLEHLIGEEGW